MAEYRPIAHDEDLEVAAMPRAVNGMDNLQHSALEVAATLTADNGLDRLQHLAAEVAATPAGNGTDNLHHSAWIPDDGDNDSFVSCRVCWRK